MLTQSQMNGPVYLSTIKTEKGKEKLTTKSIAINSIKFGPPTKVIIHMNPLTTSILLEIIDDIPTYLLYNNTKYIKHLDVTPEELQNDTCHPYLYGVCSVEGQNTYYLIKNEPNITIDIMPTYDEFHLPPTLSGYPYDQTFTYPKELTDIIGHLTATYTDRYKRPLNKSAMDNGLYFPTVMDKVTTKMIDLVDKHTHYPIVVQLNTVGKDTEFACLDLEPGFTEEEKMLANSFDAYYVEETPRGGRHYLVKVEPTNEAYKYSISEHLEVQVHCQITFYGINGHILNPNPKPIDLSSYKEVGNYTEDRPIHKSPEGVEEIVDNLIELNTKLNSTGKDQARRVYIIDKDESHADFVAISRLYRIDVEPYIKDIPKDALPWVLARYAAHIIPSRLKHSDDRCGVPYLVYISNKIIYRGKKSC